MKLRVTYGVAVVALMLLVGVIPAPSHAGELPPLSPPPAEAPDLGTPVRVANVANAVAQVASAVDFVTPPPVDTAPSVLVPMPSPVAVPLPKPPLSTKTAKHPKAGDQLASNAPRPDRNRAGDVLEIDQKNIHVKAIGPCELGRAAWYGGRYIGRHTSSGALLDQIHATAAHRTLPLNSLVRVTNLNNGHSVIVRITDRGPVSERLLIDMSPKAADELAMKTAGIVPVSIERVVEVADGSK